MSLLTKYGLYSMIKSSPVFAEWPVRDGVGKLSNEEAACLAVLGSNLNVD